MRAITAPVVAERAGRVQARAGARGRLWAGSVCSLLVAITFFTQSASARAAGYPAAVGWGANMTYELGAGYHNPFERSPVSVVGLTNITAMVAAGQSSYALLANGTVRSWGANTKEELGDGAGARGTSASSREGSQVPVPVLAASPGKEPRELTGVTAIAASYGDGTHALALVNTKEHPGEVFTWGAGEYGELGDGESGFEPENSPRPRDLATAVTGLKHVVAIAAGGNSDFAVKEEAGATTLWAWGQNSNGKLGNGETAGPTTCSGEAGEQSCATTPVQVQLPPGVKVQAVTAGAQSAYALLSNGRVLAWGSSAHGQLGNGTTSKTDVPVYVCAVHSSAPCGGGSVLQGITAISAGPKFALALTQGGTVVGWGADADGNLTGSGSEECSGEFTTCQKVPMQAAGLEKVTAIAAGQGFGLALSGGTVYAFGEAEGGHLGDGLAEGPETCLGEVSCSRVPLAIQALPAVGGIAAGGGEGGEAHAFAYLVSGSGPPPLLSVTSLGSGAKATWTLPAEEYRLAYRLKEPGEEAEAWTFVASFKETCSATKPCSHVIGSLSPGRYQVKLNTFDFVEGKRKLIGERAALVTLGG